MRGVETDAHADQKQNTFFVWPYFTLPKMYLFDSIVNSLYDLYMNKPYPEC